MGKPVISTNVGDVPLYVRDGSNGFIVEVADSAAMAARIEQLVASETTRHEFGQRARDVAVRKLDIAQCAERHVAAYQAMAG